MKGGPSRAETAREKGTASWGSKYQLDVPELSGGLEGLYLTKPGGQEGGKARLQPSPHPSPSHRQVGLDDFTFLAVLGKGNFGKVMLAEDIKTRCLFAIKVLKKEHILKNDEVDR